IFIKKNIKLISKWTGQYKLIYIVILKVFKEKYI
ncbi:hypothetical protein FPSE_11266, partial [Fusarium pseudograminearum CS3096]